MRITQLRLKNFRTLSEVVLDNLPDRVVLVAPNGAGKSTILEAIAGAKDLIARYDGAQYSFHERWEGKNVPVWPNHLRPPVQVGAKVAEIYLEVEASESERSFLATKNMSDSTGHARFLIERDRHVTTVEVHPIVRVLFEYHPPEQGVGFVDYHAACRHHPPQSMNSPTQAFEDASLRSARGGAYLNWQQQQQHKFAQFKNYVMALELEDSTHYRETGQTRDSIHLFRSVFNDFFSPKRFIGPSMSPQRVLEMLVETPAGRHDTDSLSDGEQEIMQFMAHLFRFRDLHNIILWDTPELHLNAALESRLYQAIERLAPNNQYWVATHSVQLIESVPLAELFVIQYRKGTWAVTRAGDGDSPSRRSVYRQLGAHLGLQLVSSMVVFVEGKDSHSDKGILERCFGSELPYVTFIAGGDCDTILAAGFRANHLLNRATTNGDFLAIVDRDYRSDEELDRIVKQYKGRVFVWSVHEMENLFLDKELVFETLKEHDRLGEFRSADEVGRALHRVASELSDWIAADWVRWELQSQFRFPGGRISSEDPFESLVSQSEKMREAAARIADEDEVKTRYEARRSEIRRLLMSDGWIQRLPGKEILERFLSGQPAWDRRNYLAAARVVATMQKHTIAELERLKQTIEKRVARRI